MVTTISVIDLAALVAYFLIVLWLGYHAMTKIKSFDDYSAGGRNVPVTLLFATIGATMIGGGATIGRISYIQTTGIVIFLGIMGVVVNQVLSGLFVANRVRSMGKIYTIGDIMGYYYGRSGRLVSSIVAFCFCIGMCGVQVLAMGRILETVTGIPLIPAAVIASVITVIYTSMGGLIAVILTDTFQFLLIIGGITTAMLLSVHGCGGVEAMITQVMAIAPAKLDITAGWPMIKIVAFFMTFLLGEVLAPYYVQKYVTTKSPTESAKGVALFGVFYMFETIIIMTLGVAALILMPNIEPDLVLTYLIRDLMPVGLVGLLFGALLSAIMSSFSSVLNTATVIFSRDIYQEFINPQAGNARLLYISRVGTAIMGAGAVVVAILIPGVLELMMFIFNLWAPAIIPTILVALLWGGALERKISPYVGVPSMMVGLFSAFIWVNLGNPMGIPSNILGICANILTIIVVHLCTKNKLGEGMFEPEDIVQDLGDDGASAAMKPKAGDLA